MVEEATLAFWKYEDAGDHDDKQVFEIACVDGQLLDGLEALPEGELMGKVCDMFSDWAIDCDGTGFQKLRKGAFRVAHTQQAFMFHCLEMDEDDLNAIIDLFYEYEIGLYDPDLDKRWSPQAY